MFNPHSLLGLRARSVPWTQGILSFAFLILILLMAGLAHADVPGRTPPSGAVPNAGTQQQELTNITAPAEWNVFEFVVTCGACHAGTVDQHTAHFGNWAGGNMASAARDPVFRAAQISANNTVKAVTGEDGAGNVCFRCHSPNGWLSGRFEPSLGGKSDGSTMIQSILLSTDGEGVMCETCHRAVGGVTNQRADVKINKDTGVLDKVWNLLSGLFDWEHAGKEPVDQVGTPTLAAGNPLGDTTLQFLDGMTYVGPYSGISDVYFSDLPVGGAYTGQIYAVYPDGWVAAGNPVIAAPTGQPSVNSAGQTLAYLADGTLPPLFEVPVGIPTSTTSGLPAWSAESRSIEHPTVGGAGRKTSAGDTANTLVPLVPAGPGGSPSANNYVRTSEFCGSCHELTVPILNHGMPEQRTYSEWKYSSYALASNTIVDPLNKRSGTGVERCQDCHMPKLKHEYTDTNTGTYNADPWLVGGFPYGKDRAPDGGTAMHKLTGANRDLPEMMKALYPQVDLEIIGIPTGNDPRVFPGMLSDRGPMWDRAKRNTEVTLRDGASLQITQPPTEVVGQAGVYEMKVKVINKSGHRIPSGYPDGRRFWLAVQAKDAASAVVYESGVYDAASATLKTTATEAFKRSLGKVIDATVVGGNAVQVYERITGLCTSSDSTKNSTLLGAPFVYPDASASVGAPLTTCSPSPSVLNNFILFDNRIPPKGFDAAQARLSGVKFWNYDPSTFVPTEQQGRYTSAQLAGGYDEVTYRFTAPTGAVLSASAELQWQTHSREFMEHLRTADTSTVRPVGPPNPADPLYPANPNYLANSINGLPLTSYSALDGSVLNDNWGGVAYASWLATGKGAPFRVARDDTAITAAPAQPANVVVAPTGDIDPVTMVPDVFSVNLSWNSVPNADGYEVWILYGKPSTTTPTASTATADWDRLAVVDSATTSLTERVLNPGKTYGFKVVAYNGKGRSADSSVAAITIGGNLPVAPITLTASKVAPESTATSITLTWFDKANNEARFEVWRFPGVLNGAPAGQAAIFQRIISQTAGPVGGQPVTGLNTWVDTDPNLAPGVCYYYQVRSLTDGGDASTWTGPLVQGCTVAGAPTVNLSAIAAGGYRVDLNWSSNVAAVSYQVLRDNVQIAVVTGTSFVDTAVVPATTYAYTVKAWSAVNATGTVLAQTTTSAATPAVPVTPTAVTAAINGALANLNWVHSGLNADGYVLERATVVNGVSGGYIPIPIAGQVIPAQPINVTTFADAGVTELTSFQYRVKAVRQLAGDSPYAVSNTVTTGLFAPVGLSSALTVPPLATNVRVTLSWTDVSKKETAYKVERKIGNAAWTTVAAALPANSQQLVDTFAVASSARTVQYRVTAMAGSVTSQAVVTSVAVPARAANVASNTLKVTKTGQPSGILKLSFTVPNGALGYEIRRRVGNGAYTTLPAVAAKGAVTVLDTGLTKNTQYRYSVRAYSAGGWSSNWSNEVSATAP